MAELSTPTGSRPFPLIDSDPHFSRVLRYMRLSDYAVWGGTTIVSPAFLYALNRVSPAMIPVTPGAKEAIRLHFRMGGMLGFIAGFMLAYQRSSFRFWGWTENKREEERDFAELSKRAREGKPLWGESFQPEWVQAAAHQNSLNSQMKLNAIPMFNFVNHPYHGVDPAKYYPRSEKKDDSQ
ncbi:NADH-ubiquinone oxidoreductase complex I, 21 kDa subunit-domain-containing protein [Vararia minispora EC-137]|uniref:NADH-ubiquinone oxidoreductase complex I, 21 kDa subunit-domain-containing protein n=1 Tax=Vararia minispora EC-137 TaxID=1314806 RepID=A0ACB8QA79_9AGAM|nr:NADH-ubiquinone oxidoreductase complex I, 21 kDa subunit-domain-containing protein [Vararia minispora EC-137]